MDVEDDVYVPGQSSSPRNKRGGLGSAAALGSMPSLSPGRAPIFSSENRLAAIAGNPPAANQQPSPPTTASSFPLPQSSLGKSSSNPVLNSAGGAASPVVKRIQRDGISPSMQERMSIWNPAASAPGSPSAPTPSITRPKPKISELKISIKERMNMLLDAGKPQGF